VFSIFIHFITELLIKIMSIKCSNIFCIIRDHIIALYVFLHEIWNTCDIFNYIFH